MSKVASNKKFLKLDDVRISYRVKDDSIHVTSGDEDLAGSAFHLTLPRGSESEQVLRGLLVEQGLIREDVVPLIPHAVRTRFSSDADAYKFVLGGGSEGEVVWDAKVSSHVLVVGGTGRGKSVLVRGLFAHCLTHNSQWEFYGVDLTGVEFSSFKKFSRTVGSVVSAVSEGMELVGKLASELRSRYKLMEVEGVNIFSDLKTPVRSILFTVDEAVFFMSEVARCTSAYHAAKFNQDLMELLHRGQAAGIHVVFVAQRMDVVFFPESMRALIDLRIAAGRLASTTSALLLGSNAATRLPDNIRGHAVVAASGKVNEFQIAYSSLEDLLGWVKVHGEVAEPELFAELNRSVD